MTGSRVARPLARRVPAVLLVASILVLGVGSSPASTQSDSDDGLPGAGATVVMARPTWDTGWFQSEVVAQLLGELGYVVDGPTTTPTDEAYRQLGSGAVDLWVNGWFPLHQGLLPDGEEQLEAVGFEVRGGALQGYLADRVTVERLGITTLADLADPEIARAFDTDGDGVADLVGCEDDWACGPIVDHHLDAYGLADVVDQVQGDYGPLMQATVERYRRGLPVLFYTFTPNWTVGALVPGEDVVWIPAPFPSLPADIADQEPLTEVASVAGCLADPCSMGFAPNDIRAVVNSRFLADNPAIGSLLERFEIGLDEISDQNARMVAGEDSELDIEAHALQWIAEHRDRVDEWLGAAVEAHTAAGLPLVVPSAASGPTAPSVGTLRVVTRLAPPFVSFAEDGYGGFSVELFELVADDIGADLDVYAVNSTAKLIDDVDRGEADVGVGAVAITSRREEVIDFTQPYFDSGLQILVADRDQGFLGGRLGPVLRAVFSIDLLTLLLVLVAVLILAAHVMWFSERRSNPDFPESYAAGIWDSLWWAAVTATTVGYGDKTPRGVGGRLFGLVWMFSGLFVLAYFTAGIATAFTIDELASTIDGPSDLRGRAIGAPVDSLAAEYLALQGIGATEYATAEEAFDALLDGEVDAVVHDAAILQHFVATDGRGGADITGLLFAERGFGFALPTDAALAETINRSLLTLIENGQYRELHDRWFGTATGAG